MLLNAVDECLDLKAMTEMRGQRRKRKRLQPFQEYNEEEFVQRYRLTKETVQYVLTLSLIEDEIRSRQQ